MIKLVVVLNKASWCFTSTNERGEKHGIEGSAAAPTEALPLVGKNCGRYIFGPTVAGNDVNMKTATRIGSQF